MTTSNNIADNGKKTEMIQIPACNIDELLAIAENINEGEIVSQIIGVIDYPNNEDMNYEAIKTAARLYADIHFLKTQMKEIKEKALIISGSEYKWD